MFQDLLRLRETADNTERYVCVMHRGALREKDGMTFGYCL